MLDEKILRTCEVKYGKLRMNKRKVFYLLPEGKLYATTCSQCGKIVERDKMCKNKAKLYGMDSRCLDCGGGRIIYEKMNLDQKINRYLLRKSLFNCRVERGFQKNGYCRVVIKRNIGEQILALSCCTCLEIKTPESFTYSKTGDKTPYSGECKDCQRRREREERSFW